MLPFFSSRLPRRPPRTSNAHSGSRETQEAQQEAGRGPSKSFLEQDPGHEGMWYLVPGMWYVVCTPDVCRYVDVSGCGMRCALNQVNVFWNKIPDMEACGAY